MIEEKALDICKNCKHFNINKRFENSCHLNNDCCVHCFENGIVLIPKDCPFFLEHALQGYSLFVEKHNYVF